MPRKSTVAELQETEVASPLRRSSRKAAPVAEESALVTKRTISQAESSETPAKITRGRRTSATTAQDNEDKLDIKPATRTRRELLAQPAEEDKVSTPRRGRRGSTSAEPKEDPVSSEKPRSVRTRRASATEKLEDENKTQKTGPVRSRRSSANAEYVSDSQIIPNTPTRSTRRRSSVTETSELVAVASAKNVVTRGRRNSEAEGSVEVTDNKSTRGRRKSVDLNEESENIITKTPGRTRRRISVSKEPESDAIPEEQSDKTLEKDGEDIFTVKRSNNITLAKNLKTVEPLVSEFDLSIINESSDDVDNAEAQTSEVESKVETGVNKILAPSIEKQVKSSPGIKRGLSPSAAESESRKSPRLTEMSKNQSLSPRRSPRLATLPSNTDSPSKSINSQQGTEECQSDSREELTSEKLWTGENKDRVIIGDNNKPNTKPELNSDAKVVTAPNSPTQNNKEEFNDSGKSDNSNKENLPIFDKSYVAEEQAQVLASRTSNVFKPDQREYSFIEPMEVDESYVLADLNKSVISEGNKLSEINDSNGCYEKPEQNLILNQISIDDASDVSADKALLSDGMSKKVKAPVLTIPLMSSTIVDDMAEEESGTPVQRARSPNFIQLLAAPRKSRSPTHSPIPNIEKAPPRSPNFNLKLDSMRIDEDNRNSVCSSISSQEQIFPESAEKIVNKKPEIENKVVHSPTDSPITAAESTHYDFKISSDEEDSETTDVQISLENQDLESKVEDSIKTSVGILGERDRNEEQENQIGTANSSDSESENSDNTKYKTISDPNKEKNAVENLEGSDELREQMEIIPELSKPDNLSNRFLPSTVDPDALSNNIDCRGVNFTDLASQEKENDGLEKLKSTSDKSSHLQSQILNQAEVVPRDDVIDRTEFQDIEIGSMLVKETTTSTENKDAADNMTFYVDPTSNDTLDPQEDIHLAEDQSNITVSDSILLEERSDHPCVEEFKRPELEIAVESTFVQSKDQISPTNKQEIKSVYTEIKELKEPNNSKENNEAKVKTTIASTVLVQGTRIKSENQEAAAHKKNQRIRVSVDHVLNKNTFESEEDIQIPKIQSSIKSHFKLLDQPSDDSEVVNEKTCVEGGEEQMEKQNQEQVKPGYGEIEGSEEPSSLEEDNEGKMEIDNPDMDEESEQFGNEFIDDMAEEAEESTPSEDSNEIVDEGESVGTSDSEYSEGEYENDSFICDDEEIELLSGEENYLKECTETTKKAKVDKNSKSKPKEKSRIITLSDSSEEDTKNVLSEPDAEYGLDCENKTEEVPNSSSANTSRRRSLSIQESLILDGSKEQLTERINTIVDTFCTSIGKGEVSLNLSLEYENIEASSAEKTDILPRELHETRKASLSLDAIEELESPSRVNKKRRLSRSLENLTESAISEKHRKNVRKSKKESVLKKTKRPKHRHQSHDLKVTTFNIMNQLVNDVKNRPRRTIRPTVPNTDINSSWVATKAVNVKPSISLVSNKTKLEMTSIKLHPKDFKNQMLSDGKRVKRVETKTLLKNKGLFY